MRRIHSFSRLGACLLTLIVAGCGTSAPVRYYGLVPVETQAEFAVADQFAITVGPIRIPEYLNRSQIVTRGTGVEMDFGEFDRWAEPLEESFQRTVTNNLAIMLQSDQVFDFPASVELRHGYILRAQVTRFDTDTAGAATLEVQWLIKSMQEGLAVPPRRSRYAGQVADPANYDSVVEALSDLIGMFSLDVAAALAGLP